MISIIIIYYYYYLQIQGIWKFEAICVTILDYKHYT